MNKQELIKKYEGAFEKLYAFPVVTINEVLEDLRQLDESQKVTVPQFVADWIEYCKRQNFTLFGCLDPVDNFEVLVGEDFEGDARKCILWCRSASDKLARAWMDGYEVEKEKRYKVKVKRVYFNSGLIFDKTNKKWFFSSIYEVDHQRGHHTRKELENAGFGWVFDCPGVEVEEVEG